MRQRTMIVWVADIAAKNFLITCSYATDYFDIILTSKQTKIILIDKAKNLLQLAST